MSCVYLTPAFNAQTTSAYVPQQFGEPVLVTPRHSNALDDGVFASHATFSWRAATTTLAQPKGNVLRYNSYRQTAAFDGNRVSGGLRAGDRITRSWDGATFEVTAVHRGSGSLHCDLVELDRRIH